jgi:hypothetical protein
MYYVVYNLTFIIGNVLVVAVLVTVVVPEVAAVMVTGGVLHTCINITLLVYIFSRGSS